MSIIIRLQNLPLSAKSGDIRHFFGGLRIPEGGVHIIGGEKGDAFIAFTSDEDARIAMRKDGGKIKDARIKLFLSSHMEMQYEIERITKCPFVGLQPQKVSSHERRSPEHVSRHSRSPDSHKNVRKNRNRSRSPFIRRHRSRSPPRRPTTYDSFKTYLHHGRSASPKRSRSPHLKLSPSPKSRPGSPYFERFVSYQKGRSISPNSRTSENYVRSVRSTETDNDLKVYIHKQDGWGQKDVFSKQNYYNVETPSSYRRNFEPPSGDNYSVSQYRDTPYFPDGPQALLEKRITEVLTHSSFLNNEFCGGNLAPIDNHTNRAVQHTEVTEKQPEQSNNFTPNLPSSMIHPDQYMLTNNTQSSVMSPSLNRYNNISGHNEFYDNVPNATTSCNVSERYPNLIMPPPPPFPDMMNQSSRISGATPNEFVPMSNYYVTISGLHPKWSFRDVHAILRGIYAPQNNIKWEVDEHGHKTGTAFVRLCNNDDFKTVLEKATFIFNGRRITVSECPEFVFRSYFFADHPFNESSDITENFDLCYMLKGLPFSATYDNVVEFFQGFELSDIFIIYGENGRATGTGFVTFTNSRDFHSAMSRNGRKIAHRYIELIPSTIAEMKAAKDLHGDHNFSASVTLSSSSNVPSSGMNTYLNRRPLCALLTGLPPNVTNSKILAFFSESGLKPDAIHITLNNKNQPNGRAYVEFSNFLDFDAALKCHRHYIGENMICVKQILYEEMSKILNSQKAKHFRTTVSNSNQSDCPEKVPYLWEPPDDTEYQNKSIKMFDGNMWCKNNFDQSDGSRKGNARDFERSRLPSTLSSTASSHNKRGEHFVDAKQIHRTCENTDSHIRDTLSNQECEAVLQKSLSSEEKRLTGETSTLPFHKESENQVVASSFSTYSKNIGADDSYRVPLTLEFKSKQPHVKSEKKDLFDKTFKSEKKKVSKFLSDRESLKSDLAYKDDKKGTVDKRKNDKLPQKITEHGSSPDKGSKTFVEKRSTPLNTSKLRDLKNVSPSKAKEDKIFKQRTDTFSKRSGKANEYKAESKHSYHRKFPDPFPTRSIHHAREICSSDSASDAYNLGAKECVVQVSNVHPDIGSDQLELFFHDFDIRKEKFVRRYTDYGDATGDVRVTFRNYFEAERAVKHLNRQYLKGIPVEMFIVT